MNVRNTVILLLLIVIPMFVSPWALDPFEIDKITLMRALSVVVAIIYITKKGSAWMTKLHIRDPGFWLLLFIVWASVATIYSLQPFRSVFGTMLRAGGLLTWWCVFLLYVAFRSNGKISQKTKLFFAYGQTVTATALSCLAIAQAIKHSFIVVPIMAQTTAEPFQLIRPAATFGHPIYFGIYIVMTLPFVWYAYVYTKQKHVRIGIVVSVLIMCISVYMSRTRIAIIAIMVLMALWFIYSYRKHTKHVVIAAATIGMILCALPSVQQTIWRTESLFVRTREWSYALGMIPKSPFFGYGFETYDLLSVVRERNPNELQDGLADRAHNIWIDTGIAIGIPGLLLIMMVFAAAIHSGHTQKHDTWIMASNMSLVAYLITMQTSFDFSYTYIALPWLLVQLSPIQTEHNNTHTLRILPACLVGVVMLFPLYANKRIFDSKQYMIDGAYQQEIEHHQTTRIFAPMWPEIDLLEAEAWYGRALMEAEPAFTHKAEARMQQARKKGLPWYIKPAFETEI